MRRIAAVLALMLPVAALAQNEQPRRGFGSIFRGTRPQAAPVSTPVSQPVMEQPAPVQQQPQAQERAQAATTPRSTRQTSSDNDSEKETPRPRKTPTQSSSSKTSEKSTKKSSEDSKETAKKSSDDDDDKPAKKEEPAAPNDADYATSAVGNLLQYAQKGEYSKALQYVAPEIQAYFKSEHAAVNGTAKRVLDALTHNGTITSVVYSNISVRGEGATLDAEIQYNSAPAEKKAFELINVAPTDSDKSDKSSKKKSDWRVLVSINGNNGSARVASAAPAPARTPAPTPAATPAPALTPAATPVVNAAAPAQPANTPLSTPAPVGNSPSASTSPQSNAASSALDLRSDADATQANGTKSIAANDMVKAPSSAATNALADAPWNKK